jgi:hypothetical protein
MQPQKRASPVKINPELFKTNIVWVHHHESELINNDPLAGVRGVNIEKSYQIQVEKQASFKHA